MNLMKRTALTLVAAAVCLPAVAQLSPVSISVDVVGQTDRKVKTRSRGLMPRVDVTVDKHLQINVSNRTGRELTNLTLQYYLFATDLESKEVSILHMGQQMLTLPALKSARVSTETITLSHTRSYQKRTRGQVITVPATGQKFEGYGVQVLHGAAVLAEVFEPPTLKDKVSAADIEALDKPQKGRKRSSPRGR